VKSGGSGGSNKMMSVRSNESSDSSGNNAMISVNTQKQRQQAFRSSSTGGTTIKVNGGSASSIMSAKKLSNSSIIFLGDCEMPITKSGSNVNSASENAGKNGNEKYTQKIQITGVDGANGGGELKQQFAASSQQAR
jgi:hypothetical protein